MTQLTEMNANKNRHIFPLTESIHHMCSVLMTDAEQLQALNQQLLSNRPCQQTRNQREPQKDPWAARLTDTFRQEVAAEWILNTAALERDWTRLSPNGPHLSEADARTSRELHAGISHTALPSGKTKPSVHLKWSENKSKKTTMKTTLCFCDDEIIGVTFQPLVWIKIPATVIPSESLLKSLKSLQYIKCISVYQEYLIRPSECPAKCTVTSNKNSFFQVFHCFVTCLATL